ncbi:hypothetical protein Q3G72_008309 [Acer saccharum]|nr:hypothetical protein Q3G72_008309 [Acer saccharum]
MNGEIYLCYVRYVRVNIIGDIDGTFCSKKTCFTYCLKQNKRTQHKEKFARTHHASENVTTYKYHIPCIWIHRGENLLVLHEELGGDPSLVSLLTRAGQDICAFVSEADPPPVDSWKPNVEFNYGTPEGNCGTYSPETCHVDALAIVEKACIGQEECSIPVSSANLSDAYPGVPKSLVVEAHISNFQCIAAISIPELW